MQFSDEQAEKIAPLLKEAVAGRIRERDLVCQMEVILGGESRPEAWRDHVEDEIVGFIDAWGEPGTTAEGFGVEDAKAMLEEI